MIPSRMPPAIVERLPNGFTTAVCEVPGRHQVLISLFVRAGGRFESPALSGVSHFVEHVLFRGSAAYPDAYRLNAAFEQVGGIPNAMTGVETTEFYFVAHPERVEPGLAALADMVRNPRFTEIDKERGIILDEMLYDYNDQGELIHMGALAAQLMWRGHGLGQQVTGTPETVQAFDASALRSHHGRHYTPNNMVLGICGGIPAQRGLELARAAFGGWESAPCEPVSMGTPASPPPPGPHTQLVPDADNQFHLQLSFPAPGYNAPEEIPLLLLARLLDDGPNSRLQRQIREELALAYHVGADYNGYLDAGQFDITTSVKAERLDELLEALVRCLADFRREGPTDQELAAARRRHWLGLEFSRDSLDALIERQVWPLLYSRPREIEEEVELVEGTSREDLHRLAEALLAPSRLHLVLVGPVNAHTQEAVAGAVKRL